MGTRCSINFCYDNPHEAYAKIYRHWDGGPESVLPDLERFFDAVEADTDDTRFGDPSYLAAKFVVWQSGEYHRAEPMVGSKNGKLNFLGIGVLMEDPDDLAYTYAVLATTGASRPVVKWRPVVRGSEWKTGLGSVDKHPPKAKRGGRSPAKTTSRTKARSRKPPWPAKAKG